jgi:hypothetical protein
MSQNVEVKGHKMTGRRGGHNESQRTGYSWYKVEVAIGTGRRL